MSSSGYMLARSICNFYCAGQPLWYCILKSILTSKSLFILTFALTAFSSAHAEGVNDWTGLYGGISASRLANGTISEDDSPTALGNNQFAGVGGFVGYNIVYDNIILGTEVALSGENYPMAIYPTYLFQGFADAKVKVGMSYEQWMAYVTAGVTTGLFDYSGSLGRVNGLSVGFGASRSIDEHYYFGGEVLHRNFEGIVADLNKTVLDGNFTTFSVKFGYKF